MQTFAATSCNNLVEAGRQLEDVAYSFADTDDANAADLSAAARNHRRGRETVNQDASTMAALAEEIKELAYDARQIQIIYNTYGFDPRLDKSPRDAYQYDVNPNLQYQIDQAGGVDHLATEFDHIPDLLNPWAAHSTDGYDTVEGLLRQVIGKFDPTNSDSSGGTGNDTHSGLVAAISGRMTDWQGAAADVFRDDYLLKLHSVAVNQAHLARELPAVVTFHRELVVDAQQTALDVVTSARDRLRELVESQDTNVDWTTLVLAVTGFALKLATTIASPGPILALSLLGLAQSGAETVTKIDGAVENAEVGGRVDDILDGMFKGLNAISNFYALREQESCRGLSADDGELSDWIATPERTQNIQVRQLFPDGMPSPDNFYPESTL